MQEGRISTNLEKLKLWIKGFKETQNLQPKKSNQDSIQIENQENIQEMKLFSLTKEPLPMLKKLNL